MADVTVLRSFPNAFSAERQALRRVLQSQLFQRAPNVSRILEYICEQYFEGTADKIKEYNIAVEALGRSPAFDPQLDAIVRVDLHLLRKRINAYYAHAGKRDELRIVLRSGSYVPEFVPAGEVDPADTGLGDEEVQLSPEVAALPDASLQQVAEKSSRSMLPVGSVEQPELTRAAGAAWPIWVAGAGCGLLGLLAGLLVTLAWAVHWNPGIKFINDLPRPAKTVAVTFLRNLGLGSSPDSLLEGTRIRCGSSSDYVDSAGLLWKGDRYFTSGSTFSRPVSAIQRSTDPALYGSGRQGIFHYDIPVRPGAYEVHLLFAETQPGIEAGMRQMTYTVGLGQDDMIDILTDAGDVNTATERVYASVRPGEDGKIHLNFTFTNSILNAIEILPERNARPQPVRISMLPNLYEDISGRHWLPDRFYLGGTNTGHVYSHNEPEPPLLSRERYGNFDYAIPVAKGYKYDLTLYMSEHYWGERYSGHGGVGSRIFTVRCNGVDLLENFDLAAAQKDSSAVAVQFRGLEPDATGKLRLNFESVVNYALVNAIEVQAE
jgi:hypothetical protein